MSTKRKKAAKTAASKRPNNSITFTEEQEAILRTEVASGEILLIQAIAGSGKTATVLEYMLRRPESEFLYLSFNRDAALEAGKRSKALGIKNVTCSTIDALARKDLTILFMPKFKSEFIPDWKAWLAAQGPTMAELLEQAQIKKHINAVWLTINRYAYSDAREMTATNEDVLLHARQIWSAIETRRIYCPSFAWNCKMVAERRRLLTDFDWTSKSKDDNTEPEPKRPITHVIVDEAQDINWPMLKLIMNQIAVPVAIIFCGDPYQHLYSFRHCISVFTDVDFSERFGIAAPQVLQLSKSVRFGPVIAQAATAVLNHLVEGHPKAVIGTLNELRDDKVAHLTLSPAELRQMIPNILARNTGELALLFRTNRELFETFVAFDGIECVTKSDELKKFNKLHKQFIADKMGFMQAYEKQLWVAEHGTDDDAGEDETEEDVSERRDEALYLYQFISSSPSAVVKRVTERIEASHRLHKCRCILSTIHRAKGLEYDSVILSRDVAEYESIKLYHYNKKKRALEQDGLGSKASVRKEAKALNDFYFLKYTGVTRAKYQLWIIVKPT